MNPWRALAMVTVMLRAAAGAASAAPDDPIVRVVIHVALDVPHALPGRRMPWYCAPGRAHVDEPIAEATLLGYDRSLARYGLVRDRFGFGSWTRGDAPDAPVVLEAGDHIEVTTRLSRARAFLPAFVQRVRADLHQREVLAEIIGARSRGSDARTRIVVRVPHDAAAFATLARLHRIFGDRGNGGATQIDDAGAVVVWSGVAVSSLARIEAELRTAGFAYASGPEVFVTADAPACPSSV